MNKGDVIVASKPMIAQNLPNALTLGKKYTVVACYKNSGLVEVMNDNEILSLYLIEWFILVSEYRKEVLKKLGI